MTKRNTYIMSEESVEALVIGFIKYGPEDLYNKMKAKALFAMDKMEDLDDELLDRSQTLLSKARKEAEGIDEESDSMKRMYYTLSFMLRKLAHEIYAKYSKKGEKRDNSRFLRLISHNEDASLLI